MKALFRFCLFVCVAASLIAPPVFAGDDNAPTTVATTFKPYEPPTTSPAGEFILIDALVVRPISFVACAIGLAGSAIILPFTIATNGHDRVQSELVKKPFEFTFTRPLGDLDGAN